HPNSQARRIDEAEVDSDRSVHAGEQIRGPGERRGGAVAEGVAALAAGLRGDVQIEGLRPAGPDEVAVAAGAGDVAGALDAVDEAISVATVRLRRFDEPIAIADRLDRE